MCLVFHAFRGQTYVWDVSSVSENNENLSLCLQNVDEHNLPNGDNLSQPQEWGEPIIGGGVIV
jgi:hypothetical protein